MKRNFLLVLMALVVLTASCRKNIAINNRNPSLYSKADFGELPLLSGGESAEDSTVIPLIGNSGEFSEGVLKNDTKITVGVASGEDKECILPKGLKVKLTVLVQTKDNKQLIVVNLDQPCAVASNGSSTPSPGVESGESLSEGYVPLTDIQIIINLSGADIGDVPAVTPSATPVTSATPSVTPSATPSATPTPTLTGCTSLAQISSDSQTCVASATKRCSVPGRMFRENTSGMSLVIEGTATKWKITPRLENPATAGYYGKFGGPTVVNPVEILAADYPPIAPSTANVIPFNKIMPVNNWMQTRAIFDVQGLDSKGAAVGAQCSHILSIVSPIILDLTGKGSRKSISLADSRARFDHNLDGVKENTGWVGSDFGFLVWDRNQNGVIDNGSELFGQFTPSQNAPFQNGYLALKAIDSNRDQMITHADPTFAALQIWVDKNADGQSEKGELKSLPQYGIKSISTAYTATNENIAERGNHILYESRYFGPAHCGEKGCLTYDIYFETSTTIVRR